MKKLVAISLATLIVASTLVGCSKANNSSSTSGKVKIEFLNQKREAEDTFNALIKDFERLNPNIIIQQTVTTDGSTVFSSRAASGDFPQTFQTWSTNADVHQYEHDGFYLDLSSESFMDNVMPSVRKMAQYNGKDYTVPLSLNTFGVFYNTKEFTDLGLTVPKTWDDFIAVCKKIKSAGKVPILFPDKDSWTANQLMDVMWETNIPGAPQPFVDALNGKSHLYNNTLIKQIAEVNIELRKNYSQGNTLGLTYDDATNEFANGKAVMFIQGIWDIASIKKANPNLEFSMFPLPPLNGGDQKVIVGIDCAIGASSKAKNLPEVKKWLAYLASTRAAQIYAEHDGSPSAIKGVAPSTKEDKDLINLINKGAGVPWNSTIQTTDIQTNLPTLIQNFISNQNVNDFMTKLDAMYYGKGSSSK